ncbi:hypothetical protein H9L19_08115 [Weissella diestrammenae]|uniref:Uncharacterized protein n=2 Tax=Weissella diestrammenae TaxID=1162633 RepID=A0A7G9T5D8_9LACO|nr:hypothetical protein [Weissella diestrammenae]QNN75313.1 hypothetical protein H9L19_08115 [Weissella diestrammenae]
MGNRLYIYSENPTISFEHFIISTIANQIDVMYLTILTKIVNDLELLMNILNSDINIIVQNDKVVGIHGKKSTVVTLIAATTMNEEQFSNISITGIKEILSSLKCSSQIVSV